MRILRRVPLAMRDGTVLRARVTLPASAREPLPAIVSMSPYLADLATRRAMYFASHGFAAVAIDIRGRGDSEGTFEAYDAHGLDGYDAVEAIAAQPWCDGNVGMRSGSYDGLVQWDTAVERPPHLRSIVPTAAARPPVDLPFMNGVFTTAWPQWLTYVDGRALNPYWFAKTAYWQAIFADLQRRHLPFRSLPELAGMSDSILAEWIDHPHLDEYWDRRSLEGRLGAVEIPILTITGHYDDTQGSALSYYREHVTSATPEAAARHHVLLGPWDHLGSSDATPNAGGLDLGESSAIDVMALQRDWFAWTLRGEPKPAFLRDRVTYYVTGAGEWRWAPDLETAQAPRTHWSVSSRNGTPNALEAAGILAPAPAHDLGIETFRFDPLDVRAIDVLAAEPSEPIDVRFGIRNVFEPHGEPHVLFEQGLVYESRPFERPMTLAGTPEATLQLALDVPDADLHVGLWEVAPGGATVHLASDILRARYRRSLRDETFARTGVWDRYAFRTFNWIARRIPAGNRLRAVIRSPNSVFVQKNYCGGGVVADETARDARVATIRLDARASTLDLPLVAE